MPQDWPGPVEGGCGCGLLRYRMNKKPIFNHCCNCHQCQRETGSAFAYNLLIEADEVEIIPSKGQSTTVEPRLFIMPGEDSTGRLVARCPRCCVAVWTLYPGMGPFIKFVRAGTLDLLSVNGRPLADALRPDMYIFTATKMPWVEFPDGHEDPGMVVK